MNCHAFSHPWCIWAHLESTALFGYQTTVLQVYSIFHTSECGKLSVINKLLLLTYKVPAHIWKTEANMSGHELLGFQHMMTCSELKSWAKKKWCWKTAKTVYYNFHLWKCLYIYANLQSVGKSTGSPSSAVRRSLFKRGANWWSLLSPSKDLECLLSPTFSDKSLKTDLCWIEYNNSLIEDVDLEDRSMLFW